MANNQNIVETVKEEHPDFCCKNCIWAKNPQATLFNKLGYNCFGHAHTVTEDEFCSSFVPREEEQVSQTEQPL